MASYPNRCSDYPAVSNWLLHACSMSLLVCVCGGGGGGGGTMKMGLISYILIMHYCNHNGITGSHRLLLPFGPCRMEKANL